jgi:uncharacterized protein (DUF433 family)
MTWEGLTEAHKMRHVPGVYFGDTACGRMAMIMGTGLGVWEIVRSYRELGKDWDALVDHWDWLTKRQLRTALSYYAAFPDEVDERIALDESLTPELVYRIYPYMRPKDPKPRTP